MELHDIQEATLNNSTLLCAGYSDPKQYRQVVFERFHQIAGMVELARRVPLEPELLAFLEIHRDNLRVVLQSTEPG